MKIPVTKEFYWPVYSRYRAVEVGDLSPLPPEMESLLKEGSSKFVFVPDSGEYMLVNLCESLEGVPSFLANTGTKLKDVENYIKKLGFLGKKIINISERRCEVQRVDEFNYHAANIHKILDLMKCVKNKRYLWLKNNLAPDLAYGPEHHGFYKLDTDEHVLKCAIQEIENRIVPNIGNVKIDLTDFVISVNSPLELIYLQLGQLLQAVKVEEEDVSQCEYCGLLIPGKRKRRFCPPALSTEKESACALRHRKENWKKSQV